MYPYRRILCDMESNILAGKWRPGSRVPSVRTLGVQYQANPNTVQRAVRELEREGLFLFRRGCGMMVTEDVDVIRRLRQERTRQVFSSFASRMKEMGYSMEQVKNMLDKSMPEPALPLGTGSAAKDGGNNGSGNGSGGSKRNSGGTMLELHILSVLGNREMYGYQILQKLMGNRKVSKPSLYAALRRMDVEMLLTVREEVCNGRLRKYYRLTERGTACLECRLQKK